MDWQSFRTLFVESPPLVAPTLSIDHRDESQHCRVRFTKGVKSNGLERGRVCLWGACDNDCGLNSLTASESIPGHTKQTQFPQKSNFVGIDVVSGTALCSAQKLAHAIFSSLPTASLSLRRQTREVSNNLKSQPKPFVSPLKLGLS